MTGGRRGGGGLGGATGGADGSGEGGGSGGGGEGGGHGGEDGGGSGGGGVVRTVCVSRSTMPTPAAVTTMPVARTRRWIQRVSAERRCVRHTIRTRRVPSGARVGLILLVVVLCDGLQADSLESSTSSFPSKLSRLSRCRTKRCVPADLERRDFSLVPRPRMSTRAAARSLESSVVAPRHAIARDAPAEANLDPILL